jgi:hypothetical protein
MLAKAIRARRWHQRLFASHYQLHGKTLAMWPLQNFMVEKRLSITPKRSPKKSPRLI